MPLIFQYGSNCGAERLNSKQRLDGAAEDRGRAQTIGEYDIAFDVWSQGNGCAAADLTDAPGSVRHAWGVLFKSLEEEANIWELASATRQPSLGYVAKPVDIIDREPTQTPVFQVGGRESR